MVTGSNVAPLFTVVPLVPDIVSNLGLDPITTMLGMQNGASLGLFLSPISPVMVGVAGVAHIKSVDLLKRTSVPGTCSTNYELCGDMDTLLMSMDNIIINAIL